MNNRLSSENPWDIHPETPIVNSVAAQMELARSRLESSLPSSSSTPHVLSSAPSLEELPAADPWNSKPSTSLPISAPILTNGDFRDERMVNVTQTDSKQSPFLDKPSFMTHYSTHQSITVTILPEKEGFIFKKHVKYSIICSALNTNVKRRFSDFLWRHEVLLKRYPFRAGWIFLFVF